MEKKSIFRGWGTRLRCLAHGPGCRVACGRLVSDGHRGHSYSETRQGPRPPLNTIDSFQTCLPLISCPSVPNSPTFSGLTLAGVPQLRTPDWEPWNTEMGVLAAPEAGSRRARGRRGRFPLRPPSSAGGPPPPRPILTWSPPVCIFVPNFSEKDTVILDEGPQVWPRCTVITCFMTLSPNTATS